MKLKKITKNKRANLFDIFVWLIVSFVVLMFFASWIYGFNFLTQTFVGANLLIKTPNGTYHNLSETANQTFGVVNTYQTQGLHTLAFVMIFAMMLSILITNFLVKSHPAFFIVYILVIIVAFIASVYISNQYESLLSNNILGSTLQGFKASTFIMLYLPVWTTIIGVFGAVFLFSGILRDQGIGGSIV